MPPEEFLLVPGLAVLVIHGTELAVGGGVLHGEGQPLHFLLRCPEVRLHPGGGGRCPVATLGQFLIAGDPMFGQEVQRFCGSLQILDGCPVFVAGALLSFTYANNNPYTLSVADRLDILQAVLPILNETYQMPITTVPHDFKQYYLDKVNVYRNKLGHITLGEKIIRVNGQDVEINQDLHRLLRRNISEVDSTIQQLEMYLTNHI